MNTEAVYRLKSQKQIFLKRLAPLVEIIEGSLFERTINGKQRFYLSCVKNGKQRQHYIADRHYAATRKAVMQYKQFVEIVHQISQINLALIEKKEG